MRFTFSLSFQIAVLFTLISMLAVIGAGSLNYLESRKLIEQQFEKSMSDIAVTISNGLNEKADSAAASIFRVAADKILVSGDKEKIKEFLRIVVESSTFFNNIYYFSPEGPIVAAAYADGRDTQKYSAEDFTTYQESDKTVAVYDNLIKARDTRTPVFSAFFKSATDRLMNTFIVPVIENDEVKGLLSCGIAFDSSSKLLNMMNDLKPHPDGFVALLSLDGKVALSAGKVPEIVASFSSFNGSEINMVKESDYIQAVQRMDKTGLGIVTGLPESVVVDLLQKLRSGTMIYTMGVGLFASLMGLVVASYLIAPISKLVSGLKNLKEGKSVKKIDCRASGEISEAIVAFNDLCEKFRKPGD
ncbi:MAG: hypothetical protein PWR01_2242 [Clostridiales bacterium]|jgi:HAMP domain-containing protein|nr:hypothetical protein [Clostridiales bacterium]MDN5281169.1 hypothetical protein [Candidatus Ozemobacter sp.]